MINVKDGNMIKMTKPTSESEIKYKVPVWVVWSSIVLILALSYALIYNQNYFQDLQQENTQLKEQCGNIIYCEDIYSKTESNHITFVNEDCRIKVNGVLCQFKYCEVRK